MFQNYALFPHMTISENVAYGLAARGVDKATRQREAQRLLELVQLAAMAERLPRQLSGGQQQRVALARALAIKPSILLLDEPFAALDKNLRLDMQIEVKRLQRVSGITTLIVTHDQEEALSMADRVAVLSQGRLEQFGTPSDVYDRPQTLFVNTFVGSGQPHARRRWCRRTATGAQSARSTPAREIIARPAGGVAHAKAAASPSASGPSICGSSATRPALPAWSAWRCRSGATIVHEIRTADGSGVKISQARIGETRALESRRRGARCTARASRSPTRFPASLSIQS